MRDLRLRLHQILIFGRAVGVFAPVIVIAASAWRQIVLANVLLGVNQGLAWCTTVNMKMDLAAELAGDPSRQLLF